MHTALNLLTPTCVQGLEVLEVRQLQPFCHTQKLWLAWKVKPVGLQPRPKEAPVCMSPGAQGRLQASILNTLHVYYCILCALSVGTNCLYKEKRGMEREVAVLPCHSSCNLPTPPSCTYSSQPSLCFLGAQSVAMAMGCHHHSA